MTDRLTPSAYAQAIDGISGSLDEKRWQLAELALRAKNEGLLNWDTIMGNCRAVRRNWRTVREWADTADFRNRLSRDYALPFSAFSAVARKVKELGTEKAEEVLELAITEGMTIEALQIFVGGLTKKSPPPFSLADWLSDEYLRAEAALDAAQTEGDIEVLKRVSGMLDIERARLKVQVR